MSEAREHIVDGGVDEATRRVMELLLPLGPVSARRLFGTWGLYVEDRIFGLVHEGRVYFRTDHTTADRYAAYGSRPFTYSRQGGGRTVMQYHEVPACVLDDPDEACAWAYEAASLVV